MAGGEPEEMLDMHVQSLFFFLPDYISIFFIVD